MFNYIKSIYQTNLILHRDGFGNIEEDGDFYVGNELIHLITSQRSYTLQVDLLPFDDEWDYASYTHFEVADENDGYRLSLGDYSGKLPIVKLHLAVARCFIIRS